MLLKCNECGHENQMGAIFCRECGTKLDVEKMRPQVETKSKRNVGELVKNIVAIVVLLILLIVILLMFWPQSGSSYELEEGNIKKTEKNFNTLMKKIKGNAYTSKREYVFSPEEATYLFNNKIMKKESEAPVGYSITKLYIMTKNELPVFLAESSFLGIPVSFTLKGYFGEENNLPLVVTSAKMGHLSVPSFARKKIVSKFTSFLQEGIPADIIAAITKIIIDEDGNFHITVKALPKK